MPAMTHVPGEERAETISGADLVRDYNALVKRLRAVEGERTCTGMPGCSHTVTHRLCTFCLDFKLAQNGAAWQKELAQAEQQRDYWKNEYAAQMDRPCHVAHHVVLDRARSRPELGSALMKDLFFTGLGRCAICTQDWHDHTGACPVGLMLATLTPPQPAPREQG